LGAARVELEVIDKSIAQEGDVLRIGSKSGGTDERGDALLIDESKLQRAIEHAERGREAAERRSGRRVAKNGGFSMLLD
jgi:hypothetical protein